MGKSFTNEVYGGVWMAGGVSVARTIIKDSTRPQSISPTPIDLSDPNRSLGQARTLLPELCFPNRAELVNLGQLSPRFPATSIRFVVSNGYQPNLLALVMKILFVENHATFARMVCREFLAAHSVEIVPSLAEARRSLENGSFDLLLVDFDLDDGKGDEIMREAKAKFPKLKAIAVSSHEAGNRALIIAGADAVCGKMQFDRIQSVIASMCLAC